MASNKSHGRNAGTWEVRGQQRRRNKLPACKGISSVGLMKGNPPKENWDKATLSLEPRSLPTRAGFLLRELEWDLEPEAEASKEQEFGELFSD